MTTPPRHPATRRRRGTIRRLLKWLLSLKGSPQQIALGLAVGVMVGFSPFWGLHMVIAAALATLFGANRPAAVAAVWLSNPFTVIPIYSLTYRVGHAFIPGEHNDSIGQLLRRVIDADGVPWWDLAERVRLVFQAGEEILMPLAIGGLLLGTFFGVIAYVVCRATLTLLRRRRRRDARPQ